MMEKLSLEKIKQHITAECPVYFFESTTSTNTVAKKLAADAQDSVNDSAAADITNKSHEILHGTLVIARHQTGGRGRLGRTFVSPDDSGIYMSIILEPASANPILITTAAAVAVCRAIEKICGQDPQIKWVNDIYLNNKKVCGILAEAVSDHKTGQIAHIVLGIGINCNPAAIPEELTDIAGAIEGNFSINQLAAEVHNQIMILMDEMISTDLLQTGITDHSTSDAAAPEFIRDYRQRSMVIGKTVSVYKGGYSPDRPGIPARVLDIDNNGGLKVIYSNGSRETLSTGEISIRL